MGCFLALTKTGEKICNWFATAHGIGFVIIIFMLGMTYNMIATPYELRKGVHNQVLQMYDSFELQRQIDVALIYEALLYLQEEGMKNEY